jgi:hypothetical protein
LSHLLDDVELLFSQTPGDVRAVSDWAAPRYERFREL